MGGKQSKTNKSTVTEQSTKTKPTVTEQLEYCFKHLQDKNSELRRTQSELESIKSELENTVYINPNTKSVMGGKRPRHKKRKRNTRRRVYGSLVRNF